MNRQEELEYLLKAHKDDPKFAYRIKPMQEELKALQLANQLVAIVAEEFPDMQGEEFQRVSVVAERAFQLGLRNS